MVQFRALAAWGLTSAHSTSQPGSDSCCWGLFTSQAPFGTRWLCEDTCKRQGTASSKKDISTVVNPKISYADKQHGILLLRGQTPFKYSRRMTLHISLAPFPIFLLWVSCKGSQPVWGEALAMQRNHSSCLQEHSRYQESWIAGCTRQ